MEKNSHPIQIKALPLTETPPDLPARFFFFQQGIFLKENYTASIIENTCQLLFLRNQKIFGTFSFTIRDSSAYSPFRAPFGGFQFIGQINENTLPECLALLDVEMKARGIRSLTIRTAPHCYNDFTETYVKVLVENGFKVEIKDINQHLVVNDNTFDNLLTPVKKNRLQKATRAGYRFTALDTSYFDVVYEIVKATRQRKDYPVTMQKEELLKLIITFPDRYLLFGVVHEDQLVATAVCIVVNSEILYVFYTGDIDSYHKMSPTLFLYQGIYKFCSKRDFRILDMGISSEKGIINSGLHRFKSELGAEDSDKLVLTKHY